LDAVRQTRPFQGSPSGGWKIGTFSNKDSLTGREEAVAGGKEWVNRAERAGNHWPSLFKKDDWLAAPALVKRVWHEAYLSKVWSLAATPKDFPMPDTRGIADHQPNENGDDDATEKLSREKSKYFAVLALDGDTIGEWVSGERNPAYATQLADYEDGSHILKLGAKPYFERPEFGEFLKKRRLLSPSFHLQFSAALSHFALRCVRPIVESYDGRLIYAGGDDVLALLPADGALACTQALRMAFQGSSDLRQPRAPEGSGRRAQVAASGHPGFLVRLDDAEDTDRARLRLEERFTDECGRAIPFIVPGPTADCSVGIAVAHFKSPLQDVVRAAHAAQKRAKAEMDRSAVAITLMKHSGETIEWAAKWDGGLDLLLALGQAMETNQLSRKFPHRWAELLAAYVSQPTPLTQTSGAVQDLEGFDTDAIVRIEFEHTLTRQRGPAFPADSATRESLLTRLRSGLDSYLAALERAGITKAADRSQSCIALCQTAAFTHRISEGSQPNSPTSDSLPLPNSGVHDGAIFDSESAVGIRIDPETATTGQGSAEGAIYAAHYLRLREHWRLGVLAATSEKKPSSRERVDLISHLLSREGSLLIGGQQRSCTAILQPQADEGRLPLPLGRKDGFPSDSDSGSRSWRVKWVLLSPAIWPEIQAGPGVTPHSGGWLPNWIDAASGQVRLKSGDTSRPIGMSRESWRNHVHHLPFIEARLVAAIVAKPLAVTGWASAHEAAERPNGGAKSTLLAVPAGSIYYFEAPSEAAANGLAQALNWHGSTAGTAVRNRRSTLLGEKGFGLGVCGYWNYLSGRPG